MIWWTWETFYVVFRFLVPHSILLDGVRTEPCLLVVCNNFGCYQREATIDSVTWQISINKILTHVFRLWRILTLTDLQDIYILIISLSFGPFNSEAHLTIVFWMFVTDCQAACIKKNFSMSTESIYTLLTQHMLSVVPAPLQLTQSHTQRSEH